MRPFFFFFFLSWFRLITSDRPGVCVERCLIFFISTGSFQVPALESVEQGGISNHTEAALIHTLLSLLIKVHQFMSYLRHNELPILIQSPIINNGKFKSSINYW